MTAQLTLGGGEAGAGRPWPRDCRVWAEVSACGLYRYRLEIVWDEALPLLAWDMINPSNADTKTSDPTALKTIGFGRRLGFGGCRIVNPFAFRSPDPDSLLLAADPVGPSNRSAFESLRDEVKSGRVAKVIAGWGRNGGRKALRDHVRSHLTWLGDTPLYCLGRTKDGHPNHPLMLPYSTNLEAFT